MRMRWFVGLTCLCAIALFVHTIFDRPKGPPYGKSPRESSGIYGQALVFALVPNPDISPESYISYCLVNVRDVGTGKVVKQVKCNQFGNFTIELQPGKYSVIAVYPPEHTNGLYNRSNQVNVKKGYYSNVDLVYDGGW